MARTPKPVDQEPEQISKWEAERIWDRCLGGTSTFNDKTGELVWIGEYDMKSAEGTRKRKVVQIVPTGGSYFHRYKGPPDVMSAEEMKEFGVGLQ